MRGLRSDALLPAQVLGGCWVGLGRGAWAWRGAWLRISGGRRSCALRARLPPPVLRRSAVTLMARSERLGRPFASILQPWARAACVSGGCRLPVPARLRTAILPPRPPLYCPSTLAYSWTSAPSDSPDVNERLNSAASTLAVALLYLNKSPPLAVCDLAAVAILPCLVPSRWRRHLQRQRTGLFFAHPPATPAEKRVHLGAARCPWLPVRAASSRFQKCTACKQQKSPTTSCRSPAPGARSLAWSLNTEARPQAAPEQHGRGRAGGRRGAAGGLCQRLYCAAQLSQDR